MPLFSQEVKVRKSGRVFTWNDDVLKSDIALATGLSIDQINSIAKEVRNKLSKQKQPIHAYDVEKTTHYTMLEKGFKNEAEKFSNFLSTRRNLKEVPKTKINFVVCKYCGATNSLSNEKCSGCGSQLDKRNTGSKVI